MSRFKKNHAKELITVRRENGMRGFGQRGVAALELALIVPILLVLAL